jgi:hypothetical protein
MKQRKRRSTAGRGSREIANGLPTPVILPKAAALTGIGLSPLLATKLPKPCKPNHVVTNGLVATE